MCQGHLRRESELDCAGAGKVTDSIEITRHRALRHVFGRVRLDENDLVRIAAIVSSRVAEPSGGKVEISLESGDGQDTFRMTDPEALRRTAELPSVIGKVVIGYDRFSSMRQRASDSRVYCTVALPGGTRDGAVVSVDGDEPTLAAGLFWELRRELEARQTSNGWLVELADQWWAQLIGSAVIAVSVYTAFDLILNAAAPRIPGFAASGVHTGLQVVGWACVLVAFFAGGDLLWGLVRRTYPKVEFSGRFSDPGRELRGRVAFLGSAIILPLIIQGLLVAIQGVQAIR